nr:MAG TPA: hypothetical protein [Bacteriophage sp.]
MKEVHRFMKFKKTYFTIKMLRLKNMLVEVSLMLRKDIIN